MNPSAFPERSAPWRPFYGDVPPRLTYFEGTMWEGVQRFAEQHPDFIAYDFMGKSTAYQAFCRRVRTCAAGLKKMGVEPSDRVLLCLPNCPQAVDLFYAINAIGAISVMVHPLSGEKEIEFYLRDSDSRVAVTLDQFVPKFEAVRGNTPLKHLVVASVADALPFWKSFGYRLSEGRKIPPVKNQNGTVLWKEFLRQGDSNSSLAPRTTDDPAVILYSGGTTGTSKGVLLSNGNFNALAQQILATNPMFHEGDKMLAVMPIFHGFGLGVSIHSMLFNGGRCVLVPRFTVKSYAAILKKEKCNFIAGVPSLYQALLSEPTIKGADLSCLKGVFSGGDSLSPTLKGQFDAFLRQHGASVTLREGYGTTECVTASCLMPYHMEKEGSVGIPFPDTYYKIVRPETEEEVPYGTEGEICICGPSVMLGYLNRPEETAQALRAHADGRIWIHTGDLGVMDEDGFVFFRQRIKRVIVTNGYNIYPSRIEAVLDAMDEVQLSCVIGVKDPLRGQRVKAFVVLKQGIPSTQETKEKILAHCEKFIARYALPRQMEFRTELPKTAVGKVAYRLLEEENSRMEE